MQVNFASPNLIQNDCFTLLLRLGADVVQLESLIALGHEARARLLARTYHVLIEVAPMARLTPTLCAAAPGTCVLGRPSGVRAEALPPSGIFGFSLWLVLSSGKCVTVMSP
jgi:hypothetical protein